MGVAASLPWLRGSGHGNVANLLLPIGPVQVVMQTSHTARPSIHLLFKLIYILLLAQVLCIMQSSLAVVSESSLSTLSDHILLWKTKRVELILLIDLQQRIKLRLKLSG